MLAQQRGEPENAWLLLDEALGIFRQLGAGNDIEHTEQAVAALRRSADASGSSGSFEA